MITQSFCYFYIPTRSVLFRNVKGKMCHVYMYFASEKIRFHVAFLNWNTRKLFFTFIHVNKMTFSFLSLNLPTFLCSCKYCYLCTWFAWFLSLGKCNANFTRQETPSLIWPGFQGKFHFYIFVKLLSCILNVMIEMQVDFIRRRYTQNFRYFFMTSKQN